MTISFLVYHLHLGLQRGNEFTESSVIELEENKQTNKGPPQNKTKQINTQKQEFYRSEETRGMQTGSDPLYQILCETSEKVRIEDIATELGEIIASGK